MVNENQQHFQTITHLNLPLYSTFNPDEVTIQQCVSNVINISLEGIIL